MTPVEWTVYKDGFELGFACGAIFMTALIGLIFLTGYAQKGRFR